MHTAHSLCQIKRSFVQMNVVKNRMRLCVVGEISARQFAKRHHHSHASRAIFALMMSLALEQQARPQPQGSERRDKLLSLAVADTGRA